MYLVISTSRSPKSRSRILARHVFNCLESAGTGATFVDLCDLDLPRCDADTCYAEPAAQEISQLVKEARGIVLATPIYNFDCGSEAKNLIELTGQNWRDTVVGFLCAAGGQGSYMSIMQLANSLMLDFRTFVLPRFVYATGAAFAGDNITDNDLLDRLQGFSSEMTRVTECLFGGQVPGSDQSAS